MAPPKFERFENVRRGYRHGGAKVFATLTGNAKAPMLMIGAYLRDAGFDPGRRYVYLWDADNLRLGLEPNEATGFKVMKTRNSAHTSVSLSIQARGLCARFGITDRLECVTFERKGEVWILKMRKVKC